MFNSTNIWANVQLHDEPFQMHFDLDRHGACRSDSSTTHESAGWLRFFSSKFPFSGASTVQIDNLRYEPASPERALELQVRLELVMTDP